LVSIQGKKVPTLLQESEHKVDIGKEPEEEGDIDKTSIFNLRHINSFDRFQFRKHASPFKY